MSERKPEDYPHAIIKGKTHYEGCWATPGHHNCAVAKIDDLAARGARNKWRERAEEAERRLANRRAAHKAAEEDLAARTVERDQLLAKVKPWGIIEVSFAEDSVSDTVIRELQETLARAEKRTRADSRTIESLQGDLRYATEHHRDAQIRRDASERLANERAIKIDGMERRVRNAEHRAVDLERQLAAAQGLANSRVSDLNRYKEEWHRAQVENIELEAAMGRAGAHSEHRRQKLAAAHEEITRLNGQLAVAVRGRDAMQKCRVRDAERYAEAVCLVTNERNGVQKRAAELDLRLMEIRAGNDDRAYRAEQREHALRSRVTELEATLSNPATLLGETLRKLGAETERAEASERKRDNAQRRANDVEAMLALTTVDAERLGEEKRRADKADHRANVISHNCRIEKNRADDAEQKLVKVLRIVE